MGTLSLRDQPLLVLRAEVVSGPVPQPLPALSLLVSFLSLQSPCVSVNQGPSPVFMPPT